MKRTKVVQTEVDRTTHGRLQNLANRRSIPLKSLVREALRAYVDRAEGEIEDDPAFAMIAVWDLKGKNWSERKDWRP